MISIIFISFALLLSGCRGNSIQSSATNNNEYKVDYLFEHDGCKIYRFVDAGYSVYFTKCGSTSNVITCGKNCTRMQKNLKVNKVPYERE